MTAKVKAVEGPSIMDAKQLGHRLCFPSKPFPSVACNDWTTLTDQRKASRKPNSNVFLNRLLSSPTVVCRITFASAKFTSIPGTALNPYPQPTKGR